MRKIVLATVTALALVPIAAHAQSTFTYPNGMGGYTVVTPGQPMVFINPNAYGGYTTMTPGQPPVFSYPNAYGGYTTINPVQPTPNLFDTFGK